MRKNSVFNILIFAIFNNYLMLENSNPTQESMPISASFDFGSFESQKRVYSLPLPIHHISLSLTVTALIPNVQSGPDLRSTTI